jgi:hypothetical protein
MRKRTAVDPYASERFCREGQANFLRRTDMPVLLFLKATGAHVGNSGLHRFDWSVPKCELGFWLRSSCGGRGLMTEAARTLTAFAFRELGMRRLEAVTDEENMRARHVYEPSAITAPPPRAGYVMHASMRACGDRRVYSRPRAALRSMKASAIDREHYRGSFRWNLLPARRPGESFAA